MRKCNLSDCTYFDRCENNNCNTHSDIKECEWYLLENSIQLKPITNESFKNITEFEKKIIEENNEFKIANNSYNISKRFDFFANKTEESWKENIIEEFYNVIQSMLQLMIFEGLTLEEIIEGQEKHFEKLEKRGWKFNE